MTTTPDSLVKKLLDATKDPMIYKTNGSKIEVYLNGQLIREIPLGSGQIITSQSSTWR